MSDVMKTLCGKTPSKNLLQCQLTTDDVEKHFNIMFKRIVNKMRAAGNECEDVQVKVATAQIGKNFFPIFIMLPDTVLKGQRSDGNIPSIFETSEDNDSVSLQRQYWDLLKDFKYSNDDIEAIRRNSNHIRDALEIGHKNFDTFVRFRNPRIERVRDSGHESAQVIMFIDPVRIFKHMLKDVENMNQRFEIEIDEVKMIKGGLYQYNIIRKVKKRKKDDEDALELLRAIMRATR